MKDRSLKEVQNEPNDRRENISFCTLPNFYFRKHSIPTQEERLMWRGGGGVGRWRGECISVRTKEHTAEK